MLHRHALSHIVYELSIRGLLVTETALDGPLAHRQFGGDFGE